MEIDMGTPEQDLREYLNREDAEDALADSVNDKINTWLENKATVEEYLDGVLDWNLEIHGKIAEAISSDDPQAWNNLGEWFETQLKTAMTEDAKAAVEKDEQQSWIDAAESRGELRGD